MGLDRKIYQTRQLADALREAAGEARSVNREFSARRRSSGPSQGGGSPRKRFPFHVSGGAEVDTDALIAAFFRGLRAGAHSAAWRANGML